MKISSLAGSIDPTSISRIHRILDHIHNYESWFESALVPDVENHVADRIGSGNGPFTVDAGNDDWGDWVQILGSNDTPTRSGNINYDLRRFIINDSEVNDIYFIQIAFGEDADSSILSNEYTEFVYVPINANIDLQPIDIATKLHDSGVKTWCRCMVPSQNTATLDFFIGIHEYHF